MRKKLPPVLGIDLSMWGPACVVIPGDWDMQDWRKLPVLDGVVEIKDERVYARMRRIAQALVGIARGFKVKHVAIEGYAYGLAGRAHASVLMELGGIVKDHFWHELGIELAPVSSSTARKLLLGKLPPGKGIKVHVQKMVYAMGAPRIWTDNAVDSVVVANWMRGEIGLPVLTVQM